MSPITTLTQLRQLFDAKRERSVLKELPALDEHAMQLIALSPFVVLATHGASGQADAPHCGANQQLPSSADAPMPSSADASPRGGEPGFVKVLNSQTLLIPDAPGNNRLDTLENIVSHGPAGAPVGLLFLIPGMDETLRVNGTASLHTHPQWLERCQDARRVPKLVIAVQVQAAYLHCGKAPMRAELWNPAKHINRASLPSMGEMMRDQMAHRMAADTVFENQEQMVERYRQTL